MDMKKRGISTLVATVLLILIVIAAIGIIWGALRPVFSTSAELSQACSMSSVVIDTGQGYSCYDENANEILVMAGRIGEADLAGVQISISSKGDSTNFRLEFGKSYPNVRMINQIEYGLPLDSIGVNEEKTLVFDATGFNGVDEVKLASIVKIGISEKTCSVSSKVNIPKCASSSGVFFDLNVTGET